MANEKCGNRHSLTSNCGAEMDFRKSYSRIKNCVVAIANKFYSHDPGFPTILGTGFLISNQGIVCTCRHVADAIAKLPKPPDYSGFPAAALLFKEVTHNGRPGVGAVGFEILQSGHADMFGNTEEYLGPNPPDLSLLMLNVTDTPHVAFGEMPIEEGEEIAFSGFPMGTDTLMAPGWLHQLSPTLHAGIVSAVLPHNSFSMPHSFILHANTQGGASGSPVFRKNGTVIGMVHCVLRDRMQLQLPEGGQVVYWVPTSLTGCVPLNVLTKVIEVASSKIPNVPRESFSDYIANHKPIPMGA
jgi:hypothetical protein